MGDHLRLRCRWLVQQPSLDLNPVVSLFFEVSSARSKLRNRVQHPDPRPDDMSNALTQRLLEKLARASRALYVGPSVDFRQSLRAGLLPTNKSEGGQMGLVVDLSGSGCDIGSADPNDAPGCEFSGLLNRARFRMLSFATFFAFKFDKKSGVQPPKKTEAWRVGVIQNVLYEKMTMQYEGGRPLIAEFVRPAVDSGDDGGFPFTNERSGELVPFREVYYNPNGFGELLEPWSSFPNDVVTMPLAEVNAGDQPSFGGKLRLDDGSKLVKAEKILTFGIWLAAIDQRKIPHVLAHVETFSMVFSATMTSDDGFTLTTPDFAFFCYATKGRARMADSRLGSSSTGVRVVAGGSSPLLTGETANFRDKVWLNGHGL